MAGLKDIFVRNSLNLEKDLGVEVLPDLASANRWADAMKKGRIYFEEPNPIEVETGLKNIDWTGGHVNHNQWPCQLNRFYWLPCLAAVYAETGDEEVAQIARATIEDWMDFHSGCNGQWQSVIGRSLDMSIRLGQLGYFPGWWGTVQYFAGSPAYDEAFIERMLDSTREQLEWLMAHISPGGNWRISELNCMLYCGLVLPGFEEYLGFAVCHLNEAFHRQIEMDGSHVEHNPSYHQWMCYVFTRIWKLSKARPETGLHMDADRVARMREYFVYSTAPDGSLGGGIHDSVLYGKEGTDSLMAQAFFHENEEFRRNDKPSRYFPDAGQLYLRENWTSESPFVVFDATNWGGGHCHLSRLSVNYYSGSRMLLCDPGYFTYEMSDPYGPYGRSTPAHNTITFGGMNQTEANPQMHCVHLFKDISVISATYEGGYFPGTYEWWWPTGKGAGVYGRHSRMLLSLAGKCALVFDSIECDGNGQPYAAHWQFPAGPFVLDAENKRAWTASGENNMMVQCLHSSGDMQFAIHEGEKEPLRGWLPFGLNDYRPAPMFAMEGKANKIEDIVTLLLPFKGEKPAEFSLETFSSSGEDIYRHVYGYHFTWKDGTEDYIACTPRQQHQIGEVGPLDTDGSLAVVSLDRGRLKNALVVDGLFLNFNGSKLIDKESSGTYFITDRQT